MWNIKRTFGLLLASMLIGCGGSDGESSGADGGTGGASAAIEDKQVTPAAVDSVKSALEMSELYADPDFDFSSKETVLSSLNLSDSTLLNAAQKQRAYVSIYRDYQLLPSGRYHPDANSRVLSGALVDGVFDNSFIGLNNQSTYLIEVWFYDGELPLQKEVTVMDGHLTW